MRFLFDGHVLDMDRRELRLGNIVSIGSLTLALVHPREVFKPLILMNAAAWISVPTITPLVM